MGFFCKEGSSAWCKIFPGCSRFAIPVKKVPLSCRGRTGDVRGARFYEGGFCRRMQTCMTAFKPAKRPTGLKKAELFVPHLLGSNRLPVDLGGGQIGQEDGGLAGSC